MDAVAVHLYIPLCLYFNTVSTLMNIVLYLFTFHYVSILMQMPLGNADIQAALHSIMSLF